MENIVQILGSIWDLRQRCGSARFSQDFHAFCVAQWHRYVHVHAIHSKRARTWYMPLPSDQESIGVLAVAYSTEDRGQLRLARKAQDVT